MLDRVRWLTVLSGLLLLSLAVLGCSSEKETAAERSVSGTAASAGTGAGASKGGSSAPQHGEAADAGRANKEGEAPHGHDDGAGPVVALTATERTNIGLKTEAAELRPLEDIRRLPGVIKAGPDRVALVTSRTPGRIVQIHAALGQRVRKGSDLLDVQSVEVEKLQVDLIQAENKLRLAQSDVDRNRTLVDKGIGARKELIAAENQLQAVQNEIEGLIRQLGLLGLPPAEIQRMRRERIVTVLHIPAPLDGTVVERSAVLGQMVEPTAPLLKLVDTSVVVAQGSAPEDLLRELRLGQAVRVTVPTYPGERFDGRLTFIHPQIDPERRAVHVWAEVRNPDGRLKEEMFAQLSVVVGGGPNTLVVPTAALMTAEGREFVFVETPAGFKRADVLVGARNDQYVEIKKGLSPGTKVVTDGKRQIYTVYLSARSGAPALGGHTH